MHVNGNWSPETKSFSLNSEEIGQDKFSYLYGEIKKLASSNSAYLEVINGCLQCNEAQLAVKKDRKFTEVKKIFSELLDELAKKDPKKALIIIETFQLSSWGQKYYPEVQDLQNIYEEAMANELETIFRELFALLKLEDIENYVELKDSNVTKLLEAMQNIVNDLSNEFSNFDLEDSDFKIKKRLLMLSRMVRIEAICFNKANFIGTLTIDAFFSKPFIHRDIWKVVELNQDLKVKRQHLNNMTTSLLLDTKFSEMKEFCKSFPHALVPIMELLRILTNMNMRLKDSEEQLKNSQKNSIESNRHNLKSLIEELYKMISCANEESHFVSKSSLSSYGENILANKIPSIKEQEELDEKYYQDFKNTEDLTSSFVKKMQEEMQVTNAKEVKMDVDIEIEKMDIE